MIDFAADGTSVMIGETFGLKVCPVTSDMGSNNINCRIC